jgi:hypothetical protein
MPSGDGSDSLIEAIKQRYCDTCPMQLYCATGRSGGDSYWCKQCEGYYVPEFTRHIIRCTGFNAARPRVRYNDAQERCPICGSEQEGSYTIIVGFVLEEFT